MTRFADGWLNERDLQQDAAVRLFCLPHAGSGASGFYRWKRLLPAHIAVCPVFLPGREMRLAERPITNATELADQLAEAVEPFLNQPFAVFGHSMGALLAYEWGTRMRDRLPECLFVSGREAVSLPWRHRELHLLDDEGFIHELRLRYSGLPEDFLADPDLREVFLPILRADLRLVETYRFHDRGSLAFPIHTFAGEADASVSDEGIAAWGGLTARESTWSRFPGDHFYHLGSGQSELLRALEGYLPPSPLNLVKSSFG